MEVTFCTRNGQELADWGILISAPPGQTRVISCVPENDSHANTKASLIGQEKVSYHPPMPEDENVPPAV